jgi:hypothetical protein
MADENDGKAPPIEGNEQKQIKPPENQEQASNDELNRPKTPAAPAQEGGKADPGDGKEVPREGQDPAGAKSGEADLSKDSQSKAKQNAPSDKRDGTSDGKGAPPKALDASRKLETVSAQDVLSSAGIEEKSSVKLGTYTQRAGLRLAAGVGSLAALVTIMVVIWALWSLPKTPHLEGQMTQEQLTTLMGAQKENYDHVVNAATNLFDSIIVKALLPVFTSILGYIFGARSSSENDTHS